MTDEEGLVQQLVTKTTVAFVTSEVRAWEHLVSDGTGICLLGGENVQRYSPGGKGEGLGNP
jgi:hypothetical protein